MKLHLYLNYHTQWGQKLYVSVTSSPDIFNTTTFEMDYLCEEIWSTTLEIDSDSDIQTYHYFLRQDKNGMEIHETGPSHTLPEFHFKNDEITVIDYWQNSLDDIPFFASYFTDSIFRHRKEYDYSSTQELRNSQKNDIVVIRCYAPTIPSDKGLAICGDHPLLGEWDPKRAPVLSYNDSQQWEIRLPKNILYSAAEYKFIVLDSEKQSVTWEKGVNRRFEINPSIKADNQSVCIQGFHFNNPEQAFWHGAGVVIPVFSLRSEKDFGIGEFSDLIGMIDWAVQVGMKFIQVLPVNDTTMTKTWKDSYPYNANSIYALQPAYINLEQTGILNNVTEQARFKTIQEELNKLPEVDFERVVKAKWEYLHLIFQQEGEAVLKSSDFLHYLEANHEWLLPYAAFCFLRDKYQTPDFHWWSSHSEYKKEEIEAFEQPEHPAYTSIRFYYFVQYHLHLQMKHVHDYAQSKGIALKGDIPIGISRNSVEAWTNPELFHLNSQAGAPPDAFSKDGQNWGFPTYNWKAMEKEHYKWWIKRFKKMADYFDAYRIDHILGFFRIWQIPIKAVKGTMGYFNPALPYSKSEIESFDFEFSESMCEPFIREYFLYQLFGKDTEFVKTNYLQPVKDGIFELRKEFDTQSEISNYFKEQKDKSSAHICEGLMSLVSERLFIADPEKQGLYHPRISAQQTFAYQALSNAQKLAFDNLYNHFFYERNNEFWKQEAFKKLPPLLNATQMLACGEDLGMIPACVKEVMQTLKILSLEIQRMPKQECLLFGKTEDYPYLSVCTTSTHDMSTIRMWWKENPQISQQYYNQVLHYEGRQPGLCTAEICKSILRNHLQSPSMLAIFPLQDWLSIDDKIRLANESKERINIPAIPRYYWRYRMHLTIDKLLHADSLNKEIKEMIIQSNR